VVTLFIRQHGRDPNIQEIVSLLPKVEFNTRPSAVKFLTEMSKFFELVIFTAADQIVSFIITLPVTVVRRPNSE
jgi:hypothetical protein